MTDINEFNRDYNTIPDPIKLFFCYSREDEILRKRLEQHLETMKREGLVVLWCDRDITAGKDFLQEIKLHLDTSDILLALVSPAFMSSNYCYDVELRRALDKYIFGELRIIPIILKPVEWKDTPLGNLQALPLDGKPVTQWKNIDEGLQSIAQGIRTVAKELQSTKPTLNPTVAKRYYTKGAALADAGYDDPIILEEAIDVFKQSIRYDPSNTDTWSYMAELLINLKRYEEAFLACERVLQIESSYEILCTKADALEGLGRIEEAQQLREDLKPISTVELDENGNKPIWVIEVETMFKNIFGP